MNVVFIKSQMELENLKEECLALIEKNSVIGLSILNYTEEELKEVVKNMEDAVDSVCICPEETFMSSEDSEFKSQLG